MSKIKDLFNKIKNKKKTTDRDIKEEILKDILDRKECEFCKGKGTHSTTSSSWTPINNKTFGEDYNRLKNIHSKLKKEMRNIERSKKKIRNLDLDKETKDKVIYALNGKLKEVKENKEHVENEVILGEI